MTEVNVKGRNWHRVYVGFFSTKAQAEKLRKKISSLYQIRDAWIAKHKKIDATDYFHKYPNGKVSDKSKSNIPEYNKQEVIEVQLILEKKGYNPGEIDGIWDKKTKSAIKKFQNDNELIVSGELDNTTLAYLGTKKGKLIVRSRKYLVRAISLIKSQKLDSARDTLNEAIKIAPLFSEAYHLRGYIWLTKNDYDNAISDLNTAIELNPLYFNSYNIRGTVYMKKGRYDLSISDFNMAIDLLPKDPIGYTNRGLVYHQLGQIENACADWKRSCDLTDCNNYHIAKQKGICE